MSRYDFLEKHLNSIVHSDNIQFMQQLPDECIDVIFADPPYNMPPRTPTADFRKANAYYIGVVEQWDKLGGYYEYKTYCKKWLKEFKRILKNNGSFWIMGSQFGIYTIGSIIQEMGMRIINDIFWYKKDNIPSLYPNKLNCRHETLLWCCKNGDSKYTFNYHTAKELGIEDAGSYTATGKKQLGTVWKMSVCKGNERMRLSNGERLHPTQKPEALMGVVLTISSRENDIILDPFSGTGTTAAVAKLMGRRYIGIEKEEKYIEPSRIRLKAVQPLVTPLTKSEYDIKKKEIRKKRLSGLFSK